MGAEPILEIEQSGFISPRCIVGSLEVNILERLI